MAKKKTTKLTVETLKHEDATRKNIPTAEHQSVMHDAEKNPVRVAYERRNCDLDPQLVLRGKDGREVDFVIEKGGQFIAVEAKLTDAPTLDAAKGFYYFKDYYGEDAVLKEYVICRVKNDHSIGKGVKAINGVRLDF